MQHETDVQEALRERVKALLANEAISQKTAATEADIGYSSFSAWLSNAYQGDNAKMAAKVERWLAAREERRTASAVLPRDIGWVQTESAAAILQTIQYAHIAPDIAVVAMGAGCGKTTTARRYAEATPNAWLATMDPTTRVVSTALGEIAIALGLTERSPQGYARAISSYVAGKNGLLIIDEAQHLQPNALDALRSIHDRTGCGLVLLGNETVYTRLEGQGRAAEFAQLFSRVGMRMVQAKPRAGDATALLDAWGIEAKDSRDFLARVAAKPGALRGMVKTMRVAAMLATGAGAETPDITHYKAAWSRLSTSS
ncbi:AAA family ATPase [Roseospira goensis]|nr:AAA family ATPase [Roseospira goensis]